MDAMRIEIYTMMHFKWYVIQTPKCFFLVSQPCCDFPQLTIVNLNAFLLF